MGHQTMGYSGSKGRVQSTFHLPSFSVTYAYPSSVRGLALSAAVEDLLSKGAIEPTSSEPGFYSRLFVTPKVTGGWHPAIDLSRLNRFVQLSHFRMETAQLVLQSLRPGDWMISIDLQDAYLQVPVHRESRRYLRICLGEKTFQFRVLCIGLSSTPQFFMRVMASFWVPDPTLFGRLASPWILSSGDQVGERLPSCTLLGARRSSEPLQELSDAFPVVRLPRDDSANFTFEGFPNSGSFAESSLSLSWKSFPPHASSRSVAGALY